MIMLYMTVIAVHPLFASYSLLCVDNKKIGHKLKTNINVCSNFSIKMVFHLP